MRRRPDLLSDNRFPGRMVHSTQGARLWYDVYGERSIWNRASIYHVGALQ